MRQLRLCSMAPCSSISTSSTPQPQTWDSSCSRLTMRQPFKSMQWQKVHFSFLSRISSLFSLLLKLLTLEPCWNLERIIKIFEGFPPAEPTKIKFMKNALRSHSLSIIIYLYCLVIFLICRFFNVSIRLCQVVLDVGPG